MKKFHLMLSSIIFIFLLPKKQMVMGYLNQIALQNPVDNSSMTVEYAFGGGGGGGGGDGTFTSFTIGF